VSVGKGVAVPVGPDVDVGLDVTVIVGVEVSVGGVVALLVAVLVGARVGVGCSRVAVALASTASAGNDTAGVAVA
jgi:hypothetical protein